MMKLSTLLLLLGLSVLAYACSLDPYNNEAIFMERYMALSDGQSMEYAALRNEMLTPKFQLQDYGGTLITIALVLALISRKGWRQLKSPASRSGLFALAAAGPLLTVAAYVFELFQAYARSQFPHWADSMGIPLTGVPFVLLVLLDWAGIHLVFMRNNYRAAPLQLALSPQSNWWLLCISMITIALVVWCALLGQYWYVIAGLAWLYFYMSLAAARRGGQPCLLPKLAL